MSTYTRTAFGSDKPPKGEFSPGEVPGRKTVPKDKRLSITPKTKKKNKEKASPITANQKILV